MDKVTEAANRSPVRTNDPAELARAFEQRLGDLGGMQRALAAWTLARDTLEGTLRQQAVEEGACHKGCAWCCRLRVEIRFADAAQLARRAKADPALEARVRATAKRVGALDEFTRLKAAVPCAFLDEGGACSVYEDRPLPCRAYRSRDADWCRSVVGTTGGVETETPVVTEALAIRSIIQKAMAEVTPPEWRARGELHSMVVRVLDALAPPTRRSP